MAKSRSSVPDDIAASVQFLSNRTCCVCRERGRPIQIHHIDENPSNHDFDNLAVLCLICHRDTQVRGGFDRKLDSSQIILFRNDWYAHVDRRRSSGSISPASHDVFPAPGDLGQVNPSRRSSAESDYIRSLPDQKFSAYQQAQIGWDTGITAEMMNSSYSLIHALQSYLVSLASFYPDDYFGQSGRDGYFEEIVASRFKWHRLHQEPDGPGSGGTIVGTIASGHVIADLESMVVDMVRSMTQLNSNFNFRAWLDRWSGAA